MPYIRYKKYQPRKATRDLIEKMEGVLQQYAAIGMTLTVRQLYYRMIAFKLLPDSWIDTAYNKKHRLDPNTKNTVKNYKRLAHIVTDAREGGMIDWDHIKDRIRYLDRNSHWDDPASFVDDVFPQYKIDRWQDQPTRVEVWVEKDALSDVIAGVCQPLDVPFFASRGYASASSLWEAGHHRLLKHYAMSGQHTLILFLSDHDPSGLDMYRDVTERLYQFARPTNEVELFLRNGKAKAPKIEVKRIALTKAQIKKYDCPPDPAKETDPRHENYHAEHGNESWELDAIEPQVLAGIISKEIAKATDKKKMDASTKQETQQRDLLMSLKANLQDKMKPKQVRPAKKSQRKKK